MAAAQAVVASISALGGRASAAAHVVVRQAGEVQALVNDTVRTHGRLDFIFNNAGIGVGGEIRGLMDELIQLESTEFQPVSQL